MAARVLPLVGGVGAWEQVAQSGTAAIRLAREAPGSAAAGAALDAHEAQLAESRLQARRAAYLGRRAVTAVVITGVVLLLLLTLAASRVAGHLSRQLSRPLDELVGWTERIARAEPLPPPDEDPVRGAPEFGVLRDGMRRMAADLAEGRRAAIEAERLGAFRESARQVAHELKNPLTPIRFAIASLRRSAAPAQQEAIEVLDAESARLEAMARSFAQFGRLPDAPMAPVDLVALVREALRPALPDRITARAEATGELLVLGQHDALHRALTNVLHNAVDAIAATGTIVVRAVAEGRDAVLEVQDDGHGIAAAALDRIWEPYVTAKTGGTGLGLAIVKQTVLAHGGRVEATSAPGVGTTIRLLLPRLEA